MLLLANTRDLVFRLGLVPLLRRLEAQVRHADRTDLAEFLGLVRHSRLDPRLILFQIDPRRHLDSVDWVSENWPALQSFHVPLIAVLLDPQGPQPRPDDPPGSAAREVVVVTNEGQPKAEHIEPTALARTVEVLLTIQFGFLLDEFAEHEFPGLNDLVETPRGTYNVQTQFYPGEDARISAEVYKDGRILQTFTHHVGKEARPRRKLLFLIEDLHTRILGNLETLVMQMDRVDRARETQAPRTEG